MKQKNKMEYIHFGNQCPWIDYSKEQAFEAAISLNCLFNVVDVSKENKISYDLLTPFSIYYNSEIVTSAPLTTGEILSCIHNPRRKCQKTSGKGKGTLEGSLDYIRLLDKSTISDQCKICLNGSNECTPKIS